MTCRDCSPLKSIAKKPPTRRFLPRARLTAATIIRTPAALRSPNKGTAALRFAVVYALDLSTGNPSTRVEFSRTFTVD